MDGDTKGGVAISAKHLTGVPIRFIGTGAGREAMITDVE